jgi:endonuclease/exonuclease/phosphatase family metal-dependent hydrolase
MRLGTLDPRLRKPTRWLALGSCLALALSGTAALADRDREGPGDREGRGDRGERVTIANLNLLHGFACDPPEPADGDQCRVRDRIRLLFQHIAAAGCPDVVTLQENVTEEFVQVAAGVFVGPLDDTVELIEARLPKLARRCGFRYHVVFDPEGATGPPAATGRGIDEELILSRYPVRDAEVRVLYGPLAPFFSRHVLFARIQHPAGPIDVFTSHLASGGDLGSVFCGVPALPGPPATPPSPPCPPECAAGPVGGDTVRECQARQMAAFVEARHDAANPALVTGDFNARPSSRVYQQLAGLGWIDTHLAAGNPECDPATGESCTSGRQDEDLSHLESPALNQEARIDYIFEVPAEPGAECRGAIQASHDEGEGGGDDGDPGEVATGLFAAVSNPFTRSCGPSPHQICWPSDHSGNMATLACGAIRRHHRGKGSRD